MQEQGSSADNSLDELPIPPGLLLSPQEREKRNQQLIQKAEKRLKDRGAPDYGASESELLDLRTTTNLLKQSNNKLVEFANNLQKKIQNIDNLVKKLSYTIHGHESFFSEKYPDFKSSVELHADTKEFNDLGLVDKENGILEKGDTALIRFKVFDGDVLVDDKTKDTLAYTIGSNDLSCEFDMIGMKRGERKVMDVIFKSFPKPEYIGKILKIDLTVEAIKYKKK